MHSSQSETVNWKTYMGDALTCDIIETFERYSRNHSRIHFEENENNNEDALDKDQDHGQEGYTRFTIRNFTRRETSSTAAGESVNSGILIRMQAWSLCLLESGTYIITAWNLYRKITLDQNFRNDTKLEYGPRTKAYIQLTKLMENADTDDIATLYPLNNCMNKLPRFEFAHIIGVTELISNYLDPLLSPMLNQAKDETVKQRSDGGVTITEQMHESFAAGFIEVKSFGMTGPHFLTHKDTLLLATFCKETIDRGEAKCTLGAQALGFTVDFYLCGLYHEGIYPFIRLGRIIVPSSADTLPHTSK
ncbi:hypothetical protein G6F43_011238 [Rhizopus delemar]|nr:hypothetical protein G6F43_011238 [Rhizopus delemar]